MKQFVAISDDMFYQHPELFERLVPFSHNIDCRHLLQEPFVQESSVKNDQGQRNSRQFESCFERSEEESLCRSH